MKRPPVLLAILFLSAGFARTPPGGEMRFRALDVFIDTGGRPLAAWQIEIRGEDGTSKIVGVEGGEPAPFAGAPYYDPAALQGGRIIIAAFTTDENPPAGRIRVARLHLVEAGGEKPVYSARVLAAATRGGERIDVRVELKEPGGK
jgi:hypothetical protein